MVNKYYAYRELERNMNAKTKYKFAYRYWRAMNNTRHLEPDYYPYYDGCSSYPNCDYDGGCQCEFDQERKWKIGSKSDKELERIKALNLPERLLMIARSQYIEGNSYGRNAKLYPVLPYLANQIGVNVYPSFNRDHSDLSWAEQKYRETWDWHGFFNYKCRIDQSGVGDDFQLKYFNANYQRLRAKFPKVLRANRMYSLPAGLRRLDDVKKSLAKLPTLI